MNQRVEAIDAVRGFALFGILLVNMVFFQFGTSANEKITFIFAADKGANWFINFFGSGNFVSLFSFLFGMSIIMLQGSVLKKEQRFFPIYTRRIILLLIFGYLHTTLIWIGDILFSYALMGILLSVFINRKPKTLLIWFFILLALKMFMAYPQGSTADQFEDFIPYIEKTQHVHETGSYIDHVIFRVTEDPFQYIDIPFSGPLAIVVIFATMLLSMAPIFLLGMYVARKGWLFQIEEHLSLIKKTWLITTLFSLTIKIIAQLTDQPIITMLEDGLTPITMALFYATSIILLVHAKKAPRLFQHMANMGKMSVTNYLMQSIIATTIFYAYGFGLFGELGISVGIVLTLVIYAAQLFASTYWLQKFQIGPFEYIWRLGTYWRKPAFRKKNKAS
ncbi:hypothetical protein BAMA_00240 [Bacillus manliponensis]|uniref:DUF418 domain-containing protein n=1 Tax=Bacillus manliponensis TaxID=574376 RepID=A0A073K444_9BACI|nr:DUF418 domain-containing protein [Bacillus manliponensis]KEK21237.1 hypothetical protein BAMA_00240 [Bacillus manliponensis]